jgi:antitoxin (DNA-binding transcriptional repressor) of toxin-antitoxin stability system
MATADPHMMYDVHEATPPLSALIDRDRAGEEIVFATAGVACAKLMPIEPPAAGPRRPGRFAHLRQYVPSDIWFEPQFGCEVRS